MRRKRARRGLLKTRSAPWRAPRIIQTGTRKRDAGDGTTPMFICNADEFTIKKPDCHFSQHAAYASLLILILSHINAPVK